MLARLMDPIDLLVRNATYRWFVDHGAAPTALDVAATLTAAGTTDLDEETVRGAWDRLHAGHALVLDASGDIRMLNPFSAVPTAFVVDAGGRSWYANCGWDAVGIGAALGVDSTIRTECADCHEPLEIAVRNGRPHPDDLVWHVLVPASSWWDDIGFT